MISFNTLENTTFDEIEVAFNNLFSDYYLPIHFSAAQLRKKFDCEDGSLSLSVGAFLEGELIGFILHYFKEENGLRSLYNGGTGVIPSQRGKGLTARMYEFILPKLQRIKIDKMILEALTINSPAIHVYKQIGFKTTRTLNCFKGPLTSSMRNSKYDIKSIKELDWSLLSSFWDYLPTWQNSIRTITNSFSFLNAIGIFENKKLLGYALLDTNANRLHQLAIHKAHRRAGVASHLLTEISQLTPKPISFINLDTRIEGLPELLEKHGLTLFIQQYEMECTNI